jgi:hypothetical protein
MVKVNTTLHLYSTSDLVQRVIRSEARTDTSGEVPIIVKAESHLQQESGNHECLHYVRRYWYPPFHDHHNDLASSFVSVSAKR